MSDVIKVTKEEYKELRMDRTHQSHPDFKVLIMTRDARIPNPDSLKYADLCRFDKTKKKWEGILEIERIPSSERKRLDTLYANEEVILYCEIANIDDIAEMVASSEALVIESNNKLKSKFKKI